MDACVRGWMGGGSLPQLPSHSSLPRCPFPPDQQDAIKNQKVVEKSYEIINIDRAALGRVAGEIARHHGDKGFAGCVKLNLTGSGGQSFGCFAIQVGWLLLLLLLLPGTCQRPCAR